MTALAAALLAVALGARTPPPPKVTFPAKLGEVVFQHEVHVGRREACRSCHAGKVGPIERGKKPVHALCIGCHQQQGGPVGCHGCHAIPRGR